MRDQTKQIVLIQIESTKDCSSKQGSADAGTEKTILRNAYIHSYESFFPESDDLKILSR